MASTQPEDREQGLFFLPAPRFVAGLDRRLVVAGGVLLTALGIVSIAAATPFPIIALVLASLCNDGPRPTAEFSASPSSWRSGAPEPALSELAGRS